MKKLTILLFSILISFNSYGEWTKVVKDTDGDITYIDTDTIKENNGYIYHWQLVEFSTPFFGYKSSQAYLKVDCGINRVKVLSMLAYKQSMANGDEKDLGGYDEWNYAKPNDVSTISLNYACNYVK
jgi:hypothetical protein